MPDAQLDLLKRSEATLRRLLDFRRPYDVRRSLFYRQYLGQRDQQYFPDGTTPRSNTFPQYPRSNVETVVARVIDAFFAYEDWFDCRGRGSMDGDAAENMKIVLKERLRAANIVEAFEDLVRNICIYGHGAIKVDWDFDWDTVTYAEPVPAIDDLGQPIIDPNTGQPVVLGMRPATKQVPRMRPKFVNIDIFDFLLDPDGGIVGLMVDKTFGQLKREQEGYALMHPEAPSLYNPDGLDELVSRLSGQKNPDEVIIRIAEIWNETTGEFTQLTAQDADAISWKDRRAAYRFSSYSSYRRPVYAGPNILLYHGPNPFNHKKNPILHSAYVRLPNEPFGVGVIEPIAEMTESLARFLNMIADNWNLAINRRYGYDVQADIDHEALKKFNVPGGLVGTVGDPNKIIAPLPFFTPQTGDYLVLDIYKGLIEMTSGISDFYHKGVGGGGTDTATGIATIVGESNFKFRLFIDNLQFHIMEPLLQQCASNIQQYMTDEFEVMLTDEEPGIPKWTSISPEELIGNFSFDFVAANYVTNKVVRQRNLLAFVQLVGQSAHWNEYEGLLALAKVFEIPNARRLLKTPEQVAMEQQAALMQQMQMQEMLAENEMRRQNMSAVLQGAIGAQQQKRDAAIKLRMEEAKAKMHGAGRPPTKNPEGKMPGVDIDSVVRDFAQNMGANKFGLEGLGTGKYTG